MRLIDADGLIKRIEDNSYLISQRNNSVEKGMTLVGIKQCIDEEQSIDAEPVRHGKWLISEYEYFDCSECGESYYNGCDSHEEAERKLKNHDAYAYCPHCGAKMGNGGGSRE